MVQKFLQIRMCYGLFVSYKFSLWYKLFSRYTLSFNKHIFLVSKQHWCGMPEEWVHWLALTTTISSPNRASSKDFPPTTIWGINLYPFSIKPHPYESPAERCVEAAAAGPVQARMTRKLRSHHRVSLLNAKHMVGSLLLVDTVIFTSR